MRHLNFVFFYFSLFLYLIFIPQLFWPACGAAGVCVSRCLHRLLMTTFALGGFFYSFFPCREELLDLLRQSSAKGKVARYRYVQSKQLRKCSSAVDSLDYLLFIENGFGTSSLGQRVKRLYCWRSVRRICFFYLGSEAAGRPTMVIIDKMPLKFPLPPCSQWVLATRNGGNVKIQGAQ